MGNLSQEVILIAVAAVFFLLVGIGITTLILTYQKRKLKYFNEKESMKTAYEKEILNTQLEIQEQTLKTISEEIHDNIGQVLSLAKLKLNTINTEKKEQLVEKIEDSKNLVSKAIHDLRDLSRSLNTDNIASLGLVNAIELELDIIRKSGYTTLLEVNGEITRLAPQKELIAFRIVQESLNNIIKHAGAKEITVTAAFSRLQLLLTISDDGKGIDNLQNNPDENTGKGLGFRNMKNRANMIGAVFSVENNPGKGTAVKLEMPLKS